MVVKFLVCSRIHMKTTCHSKLLFLISLCLLGVALGNLNAQVARADVQGLTGEATYTIAGAAAIALRAGASVPAGAIVTTGRSSAVDLYFGPEIGTVRLTQNTILSLEKLDRAQTSLTLLEGSIVGWGAKVPANTDYQVKLPNGIVGIVEGKYRLDARSYLVLLNGAMAFAYVAPGAPPTPYTLKAPPAVYFSPIEGVKPAPAPLQREVELQCKGKLR